MGNGGNKLRLQLFILADLHGHVVDIVHQLAHFIGIAVGDTKPVAAAGNALGGIADGSNGRHHVIDQQQAGNDDHENHRRHDGQNDQLRQQHLIIQIPGGGDKPHDAHHAAIELQKSGGGNDLFPGGRIRTPEAADLAAAQRIGHILCSGRGTHHQAAGGDLHPPASVQKLQLDAAAVLKAGGVEGGAAVVFIIAGHGIGVEILRAGVGL